MNSPPFVRGKICMYTCKAVPPQLKHGPAARCHGPIRNGSGKAVRSKHFQRSSMFVTSPTNTSRTSLGWYRYPALPNRTWNEFRIISGAALMSLILPDPEVEVNHNLMILMIDTILGPMDEASLVCEAVPFDGPDYYAFELRFREPGSTQVIAAYHDVKWKKVNDFLTPLPEGVITTSRGEMSLDALEKKTGTQESA